MRETRLEIVGSADVQRFCDARQALLLAAQQVDERLAFAALMLALDLIGLSRVARAGAIERWVNSGAADAAVIEESGKRKAESSVAVDEFLCWAWGVARKVEKA